MARRSGASSANSFPATWDNPAVLESGLRATDHFPLVRFGTTLAPSSRGGQELMNRTQRWAMNMVRWDPFRELEDMSTRLSRLVGFSPRMTTETDGALFADWAPAMDVEETDKEYLIKADLPDVRREEVKVGIEDGILSVEGERKQEKEEKGRKFHRVERAYGRFVRRMSVPTDVDAAKVAAEFKDGVLKVHLPKSATAKPRMIDVKVA
jgi:HSP20 family protein